MVKGSRPPSFGGVTAFASCPKATFVRFVCLVAGVTILRQAYILALASKTHLVMAGVAFHSLVLAHQFIFRRLVVKRR